MSGTKRKRAEGVPEQLIVAFELRQGLDNDTSTLRANGRTARAYVRLKFPTGEEAQGLKRLLSAGSTSDEVAHASLTFSLFYAKGEPVEMKAQGRHPDAISVMQPTGSQKTAVTVATASFTLDSAGAKAKRPSSGSSLRSSTYLDVRADGCALELECKFATNITSRQHDRQKFYWEVAVVYNLGDGCGVKESTMRSNVFEYVARQLKARTQRTTEKKTKRRANNKEWDIDADATDSDADETPSQKVGSRSSTRKRTSTNRRKEMDVAHDDNDQEMDDQEAWQPATANKAAGAPATDNLQFQNKDQPAAQSLALVRDNSASSLLSWSKFFADSSGTEPLKLPQNPPPVEIPTAPAWNRDEEDLLMRPTSGGRNLSRTESIDR